MYQGGCGQTHVLDRLSGALLRQLEDERGLTEDQLLERLPWPEEIDGAERQRTLAALLGDFQRKGLADRMPG